jgi:hypothetical protein
MIIIFYDANKEQIYICTENEKTKIIRIEDPSLLDYVPNDDILYVEDAHFITKGQFAEWLQGDLELVKDIPENEVSRFTGLLGDRNQPWDAHNQIQKIAQAPASPGVHKYYLHPTANGTILIEDIQTPQFPEGIRLNGKWHFIAVDVIGEETLMDSSHFQVLLGKGKVELVPESYVQANKHKQKTKISPAQAALDAILVPADVKAETAASSDWAASGGDMAPEIMIEG